jgi:hypothetical protein
VLSSCWALTGAALAFWVFRAWIHPVPAFNPNDGPIGTNSNLSFWLRGLLMAVPLAGFTAALAATGSWYLHHIRSTWPIRAAWASAMTAAVAVEAMFVGIFVAPGPVLGMGLAARTGVCWLCRPRSRLSAAR